MDPASSGGTSLIFVAPAIPSATFFSSVSSPSFVSGHRFRDAAECDNESGFSRRFGAEWQPLKPALFLLFGMLKARPDYESISQPVHGFGSRFAPDWPLIYTHTVRAGVTQW